MDIPHPTSLTFMPTPIEVAESSIVALLICSVFVTTNTALLQSVSQPSYAVDVQMDVPSPTTSSPK
jgi:hypothetical protein